MCGRGGERGSPRPGRGGEVKLAQRGARLAVKRSNGANLVFSIYSAAARTSRSVLECILHNAEQGRPPSSTALHATEVVAGAVRGKLEPTRKWRDQESHQKSPVVGRAGNKIRDFETVPKQQTCYTCKFATCPLRSRGSRVDCRAGGAVERCLHRRAGAAAGRQASRSVPSAVTPAPQCAPRPFNFESL